MKTINDQLVWLVNNENLFKEIMPDTASQVIYDVKLHIANTQPKPYLLGPYNAGKTTLANAMLGKIVAKIGDVPTTHCSTEYRGEGLSITDTAGLGVYSEHDEATIHAMEAASVILCVVRAGEHDSEAIYSHLLHWLNKGKRIAVVLNHQQIVSSSENDLELSQIRQQIHQHLQNLAKDKNLAILEQLPVLELNADLALKGRIEEVPEFVEASGIIAFEQRLKNYLHGQVESVLEDGINCIQRDLIGPSLAILKEQCSDLEGEELVQINADMDKLKAEQTALELMAIHKVRHLLDAASVKMQQELLKGNDRAATDILTASLAQYSRWLEEETHRGLVNMTRRFDHSPSRGDNAWDIEALFKSLFDIDVKAFRSDVMRPNSQPIRSLPWGSILAEAVKRIVPVLGKYAPQIGVIIDILNHVALFQSANSQSEKQAQQRAMIQSQVQTILDEVQVDIDQQSGLAIDSLFNSLQDALAQKHADLAASLAPSQALWERVRKAERDLL